MYTKEFGSSSFKSKTHLIQMSVLYGTFTKLYIDQRGWPCKIIWENFCQKNLAIDLVTSHLYFSGCRVEGDLEVSESNLTGLPFIQALIERGNKDQVDFRFLFQRIFLLCRYSKSSICYSRLWEIWIHLAMSPTVRWCWLCRYIWKQTRRYICSSQNFSTLSLKGAPFHQLICFDLIINRCFQK